MNNNSKEGKHDPVGRVGIVTFGGTSKKNKGNKNKVSFSRVVCYPEVNSTES